MPVIGADSAPRLVHLSRFWPALLRAWIGFLIALLAIIIYLALNPGVLRALIPSLPIPGVVDIPAPGPTPLPPVISAQRGSLPRGYAALWGESEGNPFGCSFLLELDDGQRVGISAAHATPNLSRQTPAVLQSSDGTQAAVLRGQIGYGHEFIKDNLTSDYVLWAVAETINQESLLKPDPRGQGEVGEGVVVFSPFITVAGGSKSLPGVVKSVLPGATWIQMRDSFDPHGFSGCPVVSQYTGRVIGMAVAGADEHPVVLGLHPIGSLVEKARLALTRP